MGLWTKVDSNSDTILWEAKCPDGVTPLRVPGSRETPPPDWMVKHHTDRFGNNPPKTELGATGYRFLFPDETEWREYGYTPRKP
jgi:hypothetical protein